MSVIDGVRAGWRILTLRSEAIEVDVLPGKGGDILSVRRRRDRLNVLWTTPWRLRPRGAASAAGDSEGRLMEAYPGGWQTVFPNGGDPAPAQNTTWGMHGEVWLAPFDVVGMDASAVELEAELVHSPFHVRKRIYVDGSRVRVTETMTNRGGHRVDVMWSHHPAFGAPLLAPDSVISTAPCTVVVDDAPAHGTTDLEPGWAGRWPHAAGPDGELFDLRAVPAPEARLSRMAYLTDLPQGLVNIRNERLGIGVHLEWDVATMPHAWYWLEAHGTPGFPWYQGVYVLGIEPATSIPGHGISTTRTPLAFDPGQRRTTYVNLEITDT